MCAGEKPVEKPVEKPAREDSRCASWMTCSVRGRPGAGTLVLRFADGFARNMIFANQIDVMQRFAGLNQNSAQQQAKFLSAVCSITPAVSGLVLARGGVPLAVAVLFGCALESMGIGVLGGAAFGEVGPAEVRLALFGLYGCGFGALTSSLPVLGIQEVPAESKASFSQHFFSCLTAGSILGIFAAGAAQSWDVYGEGFSTALLALLVGTVAFALRQVPSDLDAARNSSKPQSGKGDRPRMWPLLVLVPFYAAYLQWTTSWYVQAGAMDRTIFGRSTPPCLLQAVERATALIMMVVLGRLFKGSQASIPYRLAAGCSAAALALVVAGVVELCRKAAPRMDVDPEVSSLSLVWLIPQFCLVAVSEAVIFPALTEWAGGSPMLTGLSVAAQAAAALGLGLALPHLEFWVPQTSINHGHYDMFFFALAAGCVASALVFALVPERFWEKAACQRVEAAGQPVEAAV